MCLSYCVLVVSVSVSPFSSSLCSLLLSCSSPFSSLSYVVISIVRVFVQVVILCVSIVNIHVFMLFVIIRVRIVVVIMIFVIILYVMNLILYFAFMLIIVDCTHILCRVIMYVWCVGVERAGIVLYDGFSGCVFVGATLVVGVDRTVV